MKNFVFAAALLFAALFIVSCSSSKNEQAQATIDSLRTANGDLSAKFKSLQSQIAWRDTCKYEFTTHQQRVDKIVQLAAEHLGAYPNFITASETGITNHDVCDVLKMFTERDVNGNLAHLLDNGNFFYRVKGQADLQAMHVTGSFFSVSRISEYSFDSVKPNKYVWNIEIRKE